MKKIFEKILTDLEDIKTHLENSKEKLMNSDDASAKNLVERCEFRAIGVNDAMEAVREAVAEYEQSSQRANMLQQSVSIQEIFENIMQELEYAQKIEWNVDKVEKPKQTIDLADAMEIVSRAFKGYEQDDRQNKITLPCQIGDKLHFISCMPSGYSIREYEVEKFILSKDKRGNMRILTEMFLMEPHMAKSSKIADLSTELGNSFFFTKEEAENVVELWDLLKEGISQNIVQFIPCPQDKNAIACKIGEHWFYFDENPLDALPAEYNLKTRPMLARDVASAIISLDETERDYYIAVLKEQCRQHEEPDFE